MADKRNETGSGGFTAEEREAMKERASELKKEAAGSRTKKDGTADVLAKIAEMPDDDRAMATRVHELVMQTAPELAPRTWYGMPAYSLDGKVLCYFQSAARFKARYATFGFDEKAQLDDGDMWATSFALVKITPEVEARIVELVAKAVGR